MEKSDYNLVKKVIGGDHIDINILTFKNPNQNTYLDCLRNMLVAASAKKIVPDDYDSRLTAALPFLMYTETGGIKERICVDAGSGFPTKAEISDIIKRDQTIFSDLTNDESRKRKENELAQKAAELLAKGKSPQVQQKYYRHIRFHHEVEQTQKQDEFPDYEIYNVYADGKKVNGAHDWKKPPQITLKHSTYNGIRNQPVHWQIEMTEEAVSQENNGSRGLMLWGGRNRNAQPIVTPYSMIKAEKKKGEEQKYNLVMNKIFQNSLKDLVAIGIEAVWHTVKLNFPESLNTVRAINIGPFYHPGINNYKIFQDIFPQLDSQKNFHLKYGTDAHFLAIKEEVVSIGSTPERHVRFVSNNENLEIDLNNLTMPVTEYVVPAVKKIDFETKIGNPDEKGSKKKTPWRRIKR